MTNHLDPNKPARLTKAGQLGLRELSIVFNVVKVTPVIFIRVHLFQEHY